MFLAAPFSLLKDSAPPAYAVYCHSMFLPIGDQPNPRGTPFLTYALIGLNVAVFALTFLPLTAQPADPADPRAQEYLSAIRQNLPPNVPMEQVAPRLTAYDLLVFEYGYRPSDPSIVTLFTSMFMHGGFMHLFGNMLFLWIYGDNVEHRLGAVGYVVWYLFSGAAATLFHGAFASESPIPLVGASGAISGILGFYFVWFPHNQVRVLIFIFFFIRVVMLPARWVLGFYIVISNILPFLATVGQGSGVAHGAHIGGFLVGGVVALILNRREMTARPREYREARSSSSPGPRSMGEAITEAVKQGKFERAAALYFDLPSIRTRGILTPEVSLSLANWMSKNGHARGALTVHQRHLRDYPRGPGLAQAHAGAGLVQLHALGEPTAAYQHFVDALDHDPPRELEALIRQGLAEIASMQKFPIRRH